jgi:multicomponent K+:H+ antiporter subunit G
LLIAVFLAITVPITTIFLMRAGLFRARQADLEVPANVSHVAQPDARDHRA